jgi:hypothetical protein
MQRPQDNGGKRNLNYVVLKWQNSKRPDAAACDVSRGSEAALMTVELREELSDDPGFVRIAGDIVNNWVASRGPAEVYVTRIKNWFDHKWLRFSGIAVVYFRKLWDWQIDAALDPHTSDKLTFPPFTPNRVLSQRRWVRREPLGYIESIPTVKVHRKQREWSCKNLNRRVDGFSNSAVFVWYSSNSYINRVGSLMVYSVEHGEAAGWYCTLRWHADDWKLDKVKGADRGEILSYICPISDTSTPATGSTPDPAEVV